MSRVSIWFASASLVAGFAWSVAVQVRATWFEQHPSVVWWLFGLAGVFVLLAIADWLYQWQKRKHESEISQAFDRGRREAATGQQPSRSWDGMLEALTNANLIAGQTGRVIAALSRGVSGSLAKSDIYTSQARSWGAIQCVRCSIPFHAKAGQDECAPIRIELISASANVHLPKTYFELGIAWADSFKQVPFQVYAHAAGHYIIDVALLVSEKYIASLQLSAEAHQQMIWESSDKPGRPSAYAQVARVAVPIEVSPGLVREITREHRREQAIEHSIEESLDHQKGYDHGISL